MKVLFYSTTKRGAGERIQKIVKGCVLKENLESYRTIDGLSLRLREPTNDIGIVVLLALDKKDLSSFLVVRELLLGLRIILILPDGKKDTVTNGHKLYPRFISYADGNFKDVASVLGKMLEEN